MDFEIIEDLFPEQLIAYAVVLIEHAMQPELLPKRDIVRLQLAAEWLDKITEDQGWSTGSRSRKLLS